MIIRGNGGPLFLIDIEEAMNGSLFINATNPCVVMEKGGKVPNRC